MRVLIFPDSFSTLALLHIYARSPAYGAGPVQEPSRPGRGRRVANKGEFSNLLHPFATQVCTKKPCNPPPQKKEEEWFPKIYHTTLLQPTMHQNVPWNIPWCPRWWLHLPSLTELLTRFFLCQVGELPASERDALMSRFVMRFLFFQLFHTILRRPLFIEPIIQSGLCRESCHGWEAGDQLSSNQVAVRFIRNCRECCREDRWKSDLTSHVSQRLPRDFVLIFTSQGLPRDPAPVPRADGGRPGDPRQLPGDYLAFGDRQQKIMIILHLVVGNKKQQSLTASSNVAILETFVSYKIGTPYMTILNAMMLAQKESLVCCLVLWQLQG